MEYEQIEKENIIKKFRNLSDKYHKLSLLFYELSESLRMYSHGKSSKELKKYLKDELNLDIIKIKLLSKGMSELELNDIQRKEV